MDVLFSADVSKQVEREVASGRFQSPDALIDEAVRYFLDARERGHQRLEALRRVGQAVDEAALYERVLIPQE